ncbi:hypothetical protein C0215_19790, partial [Clostridioides difficile]
AGPQAWARGSLESWSTPQALGHGPESSGRAVQYRGPWDTGLSCPGQPVDTAGHGTQARGARHSWSIPQAL